MSYHYVYFPLACIPVDDSETTIKLFSWCDDREIKICHSYQSVANLGAANIINPNQKNKLIPITLFYGMIQEDNFKTVFGQDYDFKTCHFVVEFISQELKKM